MRTSFLTPSVSFFAVKFIPELENWEDLCLFRLTSYLQMPFQCIYTDAYHEENHDKYPSVSLSEYMLISKKEN